MCLSRSPFNHWFTDTLKCCVPHTATLESSGHIYEALKMFHHRVYTCTKCVWWCEVFERGTSRAPDEAATERVCPATSRRCRRLSRGVRGSRSSNQIIFTTLLCILSRVERCDGSAPLPGKTSILQWGTDLGCVQQLSSLAVQKPRDPSEGGQFFPPLSWLVGRCGSWRSAYCHKWPPGCLFLAAATGSFHWSPGGCVSSSWTPAATVFCGGRRWPTTSVPMPPGGEGWSWGAMWYDLPPPARRILTLLCHRRTPWRWG